VIDSQAVSRPREVGKGWSTTVNVDQVYAGQTAIPGEVGRSGPPRRKIFTIFEGTSEIQRLVVARAISGMYIK
jgi:alkylation response protein AidB-like acyl-CoA dehydrogenase